MAKPRILCVDSSADDCELLRFVLSDAGYEVEAVQTLAEGVQVALSSLPDLYLLDVYLPDGTGFDLVKRIRTLTPVAPVIICSADVRETTRQQATAVGVQAFMAKPVNLDVLTETVARLLPGH
ncbi:response regulator [Pseudanabaena sp. FACHB-2040]|uniref:response regulator n=1 Tax=Pseudanabaena sp. FACHB-2040 TaxID=2692859 RepID=UPI001682C510|nr:response regulator [Pseudanabaena sp. FACHB-2040]MBD2258158.1 response regulator [Pseudanabaena sp. FACHB-2040]